MKRGSTVFLRGVIFVMGAAVLALCLYILPEAISNERVGEYRPVIFGMCIAAIPFFIALYQALNLLSYIDTNKAFSPLSVTALKNIKYCAVAISVLYAAGMPYIVYVADKDDAPGAVAIGLVIIFASLVIAVFAALLQALLQNAIDIKAENDLTV
jgi:hypothetical protein